MKKKLIAFIAIIALMALIVIPLTGCGGEPIETENPLVELQNDFDELSADFTSEIANIKSRLSSIETSGIPSTITNRILALEANYSSLQTQVNTLNAGSGTDLTAINNTVNTIAADLLAANSSIDSIRNELLSIKANANTLENRFYSLAADCDDRLVEVELRIVGILNDLQSYEDTVTDMQTDIIEAINDIEENTENVSLLNNEINLIKNRLVALETSTDAASISRFVSGSSYLEFRTNKAGDYVVVITLYGDGLDGITFYLSPSQGAEIVFDNYYGTSRTMRTIILQMEDIGTPAVPQNWQAGKIFEVDFTGTGFSVDYVTLDIGER